MRGILDYWKETYKEIKKCKNKECQKIMPEGCKYKYCEACRGKRAEGVMSGLKVVGICGSIILCVATKGHVSKKN